MSTDANTLYLQWKSSQGDTRAELLPLLVKALEKHAQSICWLKVPDFQDEHSWIVTEAVWRAVSNIEKFDANSKFSTWFQTIITNECNRFLKQKETRKSDITLVEAESKSLAITEYPFVDSIRAQEMMSELSESDQLLVEARMEGLDYNEIGELLGILPATARKRWQAIKAKLQ